MKSLGNPLTVGLSGQLAKVMVFRQTKRGTVVTKYPRVGAMNSEAQIKVRDAFARAAEYAKEHLNDEWVIKYAARHRLSTFNAAVAQYFKENPL